MKAPNSRLPRVSNKEPACCEPRAGRRERRVAAMHRGTDVQRIGASLGRCLRGRRPAPRRTVGDAGQRHALVASRVQQVQADEKRLRVGTHQDLAVKDVITDPDGMQHVRDERTYDGLPVIGGDLVLHENSDGTTDSVSWAPARRSASRPRRDRGTVPHLARAAQARRVVYASTTAGPGLGEAVWGVAGRHADQPPGLHRRADRQAARRRENIVTDGTGKSLYSGTVPVGATRAAASRFSLTDSARGGHKTYDATGITSECDPARDPVHRHRQHLGRRHHRRRQSAAVDAHYGAATHLGLLQEHPRPQRHPQRRQGRRTRACTSAPATRTPSGTTPASA